MGGCQDERGNQLVRAYQLELCCINTDSSETPLVVKCCETRGVKLKTPPDPKLFGPAGQKHGILDLFRFGIE